MTATIERLKAIPPIPARGKRYLSLDATLVNLWDACRIAESLGFLPELVQIPYQAGTELHILLWDGINALTPPDFDDRVGQLADMVNAEAIRHVYSRDRVVASLPSKTTLQNLQG